MPETSSRTRHVIGVMTGTSIDGIDAAIIRLDGPDAHAVGNGESLQVSLVKHISRPLGPLARPLRQAADQQPMTAGQFAELAWAFGLLHCEVIGQLVQGQPAPDRIVVHGQTVFHQPPLSLQMVNPAPIAARFDCPVAYDLRQADLARGGQGAPITPAADWVLFRHRHRARAIINLGGFCNVSILPADDRPGARSGVRGFDVCACNQLLDAVARRTIKAPFDEGGNAALAGTADAEAGHNLLELLQSQRDAERSLGTGDEASRWIEQYASQLSPQDLAATAVRSIATCIAEAVEHVSADEALLAGGGVRNRALLRALTDALRTPICLTSDVGIPIDAREAVAIAILGSMPTGYSIFTP